MGSKMTAHLLAILMVNYLILLMILRGVFLLESKKKIGAQS